MTSSHPPLLHLVAGGDQPTVLDVAKRLLSEGANADEAEPEDGLTPLHVAAHWDRLAMVQLLLLHGANPMREDHHGRTPMSMAVGETKKFLERVHDQSELERKTLLRRIADLHFGTRLSKALKGARKKMRRTIGAMFTSGRRRSQSANNVPVMSSTPRPSVGGSTTASYFTANDETQRPRPTVVIPSAPPLEQLNDGLLVLEWRRPVTPPTSNPLKTILGGGSTVKKKEDDKVTQRKKKNTPKKKKNESDNEWTPSDKENDQGEEAASASSRRTRTPDGLRIRVSEMSEARLRSELRTYGIEAGPIAKGGNIRKMYEKKLIDIMKEDEKAKRTPDTGVKSTKSSTSTAVSSTPPPSSSIRPSTAISQSPSSSTGTKYSRPLELAIAGRAWNEGVAVAADESIRSMFINKGVTAFCYLLLDPRTLSARVEDVTMAQFIDSIFYVGKGTKARPLQHLIDAKRERESNQPRLTTKLSRILDIWSCGWGVISLQISQNICDEEALTREGSLIESIGLRNLTNIQSGKFYGGVTHWQPIQKAQLGTLMLKRARHVLLAEGLRPIKPEALPDTLFKPPPSGAIRRPVAPTSASKKPPPHPPGIQNHRRQAANK